MVRRVLLLCSVAMLVAGCSTLTEGTSQSIAVETTPRGATCSLTRDGQLVATVDETPGTAVVPRGQDDIDIACVKTGVGQGSFTDHSDVAAAAFSNAITAGAGFVVDYATGAYRKYQSDVRIALDREPGGVAAEPLEPPPVLPAPVASAPAASAPVDSTPASAPAAAAPPPAEVAAAPVVPAPSAAAPRVFGIGVEPVVGQDPGTERRNGVIVMVVQPGSAAARAGIAEGDIVTSIGGQAILARGDVQRVIGSLPVGSAVLVHVVRGTKQLDLTARP
jgi:PDZ domain